MNAFGNSEQLVRKINESAEALARELGISESHPAPKIGIVLGSGLGLFAKSLQIQAQTSFSKIPHLPMSTVPGHDSQWILGTTAASKKNILVQMGRIHGYEGHDPALVTLPIRIMAKLGIQTILLTNAAGGLNPEFNAGDFALIDDHVNFTGSSPLRGLVHPELGPQFVDLSFVYDRNFNTTFQNHVKKIKPEIPLHRGIYFGFSGPMYETPAEVRLCGQLGGGMVGMSTVHEAIVAKQCGIRLIGLSCITNKGSGLSTQPLSHTEVAEMANKRAPDFVWLVNEIISMLHGVPCP